MKIKMARLKCFKITLDLKFYTMNPIQMRKYLHKKKNMRDNNSQERDLKAGKIGILFYILLYLYSSQ